MRGLSILFEVKDGCSITADETRLVDLALWHAKSSEIPDDQIENVLDYLNTALLHNKIGMSANQVTAFETLISALEVRC